MIRLLPPFQVQLRRPSRSCRDRALRAGAVHARRPRPRRGPQRGSRVGVPIARSKRSEEHGRRRAQRQAERRDGRRVRAWSQPCPDPARNTVQTDVVNTVSARCRMPSRSTSTSPVRAAHSGRPITSLPAATPTGEPWCERPHPFKRGATRRRRRRGRSHHGLLIDPRRRGVFDGRHRVPPDRGDATDKYLSERVVSAHHARRALDCQVLYARDLDERFRTTYAVPRLSPTRSPFSTPDGTPTSGVSCKYWCGSSANSTRPHPRCRWSRRSGD